MKLGMKEETAIKWCGEALEALENEPNEIQVLMSNIKNSDIDKKSERNF